MDTIEARMSAIDADLGELDETTRRAALLVAIAHETRDRGVWGGDRALVWWERFPDKVRAACYGGPTLNHWWERVSRMLGCTQPYKTEDRQLLGRLLAGGDDGEVLAVLRSRAEALCLRVRLSLPQTKRTKTEQEGML